MIYLTAIENGFTKDSILLDEPMSISQGNGMPAWEPQNLTHKFNGPVSLQEAFIRSLNMPAIQIGVSVGLDKIYKTASRLGVYPAPQNDQIPCKLDNIAKKYCTNYSLLLGAFETTLMNLTTAYATIASGGYLIKPILIDKIYDNQGNVLYKDSNLSIIANNDSPNIQVFKDKIIKNNAVDKMIDLLHKAVPRTKVTIIGKTGTTNDSFDTWFIGSSKDFTVGIFIGYDLPKSLGKHEIGAVVARPVFMHFIDNMSKYITDGPIGSNHPGIEMINTNDTLEELEDEQAIECIELMKTPHQLKYNDYDDDAYRTKNYIN